MAVQEIARLHDQLAEAEAKLQHSSQKTEARAVKGAPGSGERPVGASSQGSGARQREGRSSRLP